MKSLLGRWGSEVPRSPVAFIFQLLSPNYGLLVGKAAGNKWLLGVLEVVGCRNSKALPEDCPKTERTFCRKATIESPAGVYREPRLRSSACRGKEPMAGGRSTVASDLLGGKGEIRKFF